jgi:hypothetical protein
MMDGRLIGAAGLKIIVSDELHIGGLGRGSDLLTPDSFALRKCAAA